MSLQMVESYSLEIIGKILVSPRNSYVETRITAGRYYRSFNVGKDFFFLVRYMLHSGLFCYVGLCKYLLGSLYLG